MCDCEDFRGLGMIDDGYEDDIKRDTITLRQPCKLCGWPMLSACNNDGFDSGLPEEKKGYDWYKYCTNKGCKNHEAKGIGP